MIIGPTGCGKTSLANALNHLNETLKPTRRTQNIIYGCNTIDVPGSYLENGWMYKHIIAASQDASHILILVDPTNSAEVYSPGFAKVFRVPVYGVVMKHDLNSPNEERCMRQLQKIGIVEPYFKISISDAQSINALKEALSALVNA